MLAVVQCWWFGVVCVGCESWFISNDLMMAVVVLSWWWRGDDGYGGGVVMMVWSWTSR